MDTRPRIFLLLFVAAIAAMVALPATSSAARYGSRTLKKGAKGKDVKQLQRYLTKAGHRIQADGEFGPGTAQALKATKSELELKPDGVATRRQQRTIRRAVTNSTGGAVYRAPPNPRRVVPGGKGTVTADGYAIAPSFAPQVVKDVIAAGNLITMTPYKWGGGHGSWTDTGYDCSGSVSFALHGGGLVDSPLVSGDYARWGSKGPGRWITIYANGGHVYMVVAGMRFDTSARSVSGSRWTEEMRPSDGFTVTHPRGL
jgi:cell wall-associated NlpC family hydrolase